MGVAVGLHAEELGGQVLAVLGVPPGHPDKRRVLGESAARVLVEADRDTDVVVAGADAVRARLGGAGRGGAGVEHAGERDAGESHHRHDGVRVGDRPAAADGELDVFPLDTRVGHGREDRLGPHLHGGLALEATERM